MTELQLLIGVGVLIVWGICLLAVISAVTLSGGISREQEDD